MDVPAERQANRTLLGIIVARMIRRAVEDGRWTVDPDGRARPVDRPAGLVLQFPQGSTLSVEETEHAAP